MVVGRLRVSLDRRFVVPPWEFAGALVDQPRGFRQHRNGVE
jgi:hypothetical protein